MSKKKIKMPFSFIYDAPVTLTFVIISLLFFIFDSLILKNKITPLILSSPTTSEGTLPFEIKNFLSYLRFFMYSFGGNFSLFYFANLIFILLLGPSIEEKYGSVVIGIMMVVSSVFAGVLNACFRSASMIGATSIVFMLIFLNAFLSFSKKKIPMSFVVVFGVYIVFNVIEPKVNVVVELFINIAGGLCGSLFAFLASPKARKVKKAEGLMAKAEILADFDDSNSPRFKNKFKFGKAKKEKPESEAKKEESSDETVVGTIKF